MGMLFSQANLIQNQLSISNLQAQQQKLTRTELQLTNASSNLGQQESYWTNLYNNGGSNNAQVQQQLQFVQNQKQNYQYLEQNIQAQLATVQTQLQALQTQQSSLQKSVDSSVKSIFGGGSN